ncbi:MAG TPA: ATP-binding protein [Bacteroides sp.]|nr:ATP-binding protein [Bacteroides sp.]
MLLTETISVVIDSQKETSSRQDPGIRRDDLHQIKLYGSFVLVVLGVRRSGKSTFLKQLLKERYQNPLLLNLEDPRLSGFELEDFLRLDTLVKERAYEAMAFDEIQIVENWESYIRSKQEESLSILVTGSNASLLDSDFGTKLTGRYLIKEVFPFSYIEFLTISKEHPSADSMEQYLELGGFPEYLKTRNEEVLYRLMDDIIYRDIAVRYGIKQHKILRQLATYLISNSSKLYSLNNLKNVLGIRSVRSVADYVSYFENSYLICSVPKFSFSIKKQIVNPRKVYCIDTGLASVNSLSLSKDLGRKLENIIFLHLRRKERSIYYYSEKHECDFIVVRKEDPVLAIQVCYHLTQNNLDRELNGLHTAMSELQIPEGIIVTFDQEDTIEFKNKKIKVYPAWKYLMDELQ